EKEPLGRQNCYYHSCSFTYCSTVHNSNLVLMLTKIVKGTESITSTKSNKGNKAR
ncbi:hypothetical protein MKW98_015526, partial [Papaver atlanticum]